MSSSFGSYGCGSVTEALKMIKRGDRVKLTARAAASFNNNRRPGKIDWTDRRGVVKRITTNKANAIVLWDGRKSPDDVPIRSIELADKIAFVAAHPPDIIAGAGKIAAD